MRILKKALTLRFLMLLLTAALLSSAFACADKKPSESADITTAEETTAADTETLLYENLPEGDYDGYNFRMIQYKETSAITAYCDATELNGEVINDDIYTRSRAIEQKLNIVINFTLETLEKVNTIMKNAIMSAEDAYDVFWQHSSFTTQNFLSKGYLIDQSKIDTLDFNNPWWNKSAIESISIGPKIFYGFGDINIQLFDFQSIITFNKDIIAEYNLESPYDLTEKNEWTIDRFFELGTAVAGDLNGNGKTDDEDMFGYGGYATATMFGFLHGCNTTLFEKDSENIPVYTGINEKYMSVYEKFATFIGNKTISRSNDNYTDIFTNGRLLFMSMSVGQLNPLREIKPDYGIVPFPKYDMDQDKYYSFVTNQIQPTVIPITNSDLSRTGTVLENLSAESYRLVRDDYFTVLLNYKYVRDETSIEMLNLIYESPACFEIEHIYLWANAQDVIAGGLMKGNTDIASAMAKIEPKMLIAIDETTAYLADA